MIRLGEKYVDIHRNLPSFVTWDIADVEALFTDDHLIIEEFARQGVQARSVVWRDRQINWDEFDLALIRSTWDYIDHRESFLAALGNIEASSCALFNPIEAVKWNSDKSYLLDLASWDIPIVPTYSASSDIADLVRMAAQEWRGHVLLKKPAAGDYRAHGIYGGTIESAQPLPGDLLGVKEMLTKLPFDLLYARIDLVRVEGRLSVLELELIEPMLYLHLSPATVGRFVASSIARMDQGE